MAKLGEKYETMVVFSLKNGEEQIETLKAKFTEMINSGAQLISVSEWGKRRLAYPIEYESEGHYVLYCFDSKPDFPKEFERVLNITDGILRFLTVLRRTRAVAADARKKPRGAVSSEEEGVLKPENAEIQQIKE
jgi:small subunit ribosomal protein S6